MNFDGFVLYEGLRAEDIGQSGIPPMNTDQLQFQLKCAVLRNMKGGGEPTDFAKFDYVLEDIARRLLECTNLSYETISSGLKWWVVEEYVYEKQTSSDI
jgi:hypothetical protein